MWFEIVGTIEHGETIACDHGIRDLARLRKRYGSGRRLKRKGIASVRLGDGSLYYFAELHWMKLPGSAERR